MLISLHLAHPQKMWAHVILFSMLRYYYTIICLWQITIFTKVNNHGTLIIKHRHNMRYVLNVMHNHIWVDLDEEYVHGAISLFQSTFDKPLLNHSPVCKVSISIVDIMVPTSKYHYWPCEGMWKHLSTIRAHTNTLWFEHHLTLHV